MKRLLLSALLFSVFALYGYSQSLSLSDSHGPIAPNSFIVQAGTPDSSTLVTYLNVTNTSSNNIDVLVKKVELSLADSTEVTMCWAGGCTGAATYVSPAAQPFTPGQVVTEFSGHYTALTSSYYFNPGESVVRWVFFDRANANDSVSITVKYTSFGVGMAEAIGRQGVLSNIYPNPVSTEAWCTYSLPAGAQGTLVIRDLLGSSVQAMVLPASGGKATINGTGLNNGIYFCSLLVDGKISQTKKLIVKH
jgi:hypothetical protein